MARVRLDQGTLVFESGSFSVKVVTDGIPGVIVCSDEIQHFDIEQTFERETGLTIKQFFRSYVRTHFPRRCPVCQRRVRSAINSYPQEIRVTCGCIKTTEYSFFSGDIYDDQ